MALREMELDLYLKMDDISESEPFLLEETANSLWMT
jgi:hypothetical protein